VQHVSRVVGASLLRGFGGLVPSAPESGPAPQRADSSTQVRARRHRLSACPAPLAYSARFRKATQPGPAGVSAILIGMLLSLTSRKFPAMIALALESKGSRDRFIRARICKGIGQPSLSKECQNFVKKLASSVSYLQARFPREAKNTPHLPSPWFARRSV